MIERHPIASALIAVLLVGLLCIGGVVVHLEYEKHVTPIELNIQGQNNRKTYAFQQGLRDQIDEERTAFDDPSATPGQQKDLALTICHQIAQLTGTVPTDITTFEENNCS